MIRSGDTDYRSCCSAKCQPRVGAWKHTGCAPRNDGGKPRHAKETGRKMRHRQESLLPYLIYNLGQPQPKSSECFVDIHKFFSKIYMERQKIRPASTELKGKGAGGQTPTATGLSTSCRDRGEGDCTGTRTSVHTTGASLRGWPT